MQQALDLIIVGAGPAGLAAALYAARSRLATVTLERMGAGGQLINVDRIGDYPGFPAGIAGYELSAYFSEQAMDAGAKFIYEEALAIEAASGGWLVRTDGKDYVTRAVIVAVGSTLARLGVVGEKEFDGRGVSYCALCDGGFVAGQPVAVVGGGDSALDEAQYLSTICSQVTVIYRGPELQASRVLRDRVRTNPKIILRPNTRVEGIIGAEVVEAVTLRAAGSSAEEQLPVAGIFVYVGLSPNTGLLGNLAALDAGGHVLTDAWMCTQAPGLFAAGDIRQNSARQIATCVGDGVTAAVAAERYIRGVID